MDVGRKVLPTAGVFHEFEGLRFQIGGKVDDDVEVAVKPHPVLGCRTKDKKPSATLGAEGPHLRHDEIGRGPPSGGFAGLPLGNGHNAGHGLSSTKIAFHGKYKSSVINKKGHDLLHPPGGRLPFQGGRRATEGAEAKLQRRRHLAALPGAARRRDVLCPSLQGALWSSLRHRP